MKKLCFYVLLILIISIGSICYAYTEKEQDLIDKLQILIDKGYLQDEFITNMVKSAGYQTVNNYAYCSILITSNASSYLANKLILFFSKGAVVNRTPTNLWGDYWYEGTSTVINFDGTGSAGGNYALNNCTFIYGYSPCGINTRSLYIEPGAEYGGNVLFSAFNFEPNYFQKVTFTGINDEFNALKYDYSINSWNLGTFEDIPEEVDKVVIDLFNHDGGLLLSDSFLTFTKQFSQGKFFIYNNNLNIYSRLVKYNTKYNLLMYTYDDTGNFLDSYQYNYVFYPTNATIENGVVISPGSGDYNTQDSTNDTISNLNDTTPAYDTMARLSESGELVQQLNYKVYPNHSYDILFAMTQNIVNTLYDSGDVYLDIDFEHNGYVHRVYSSQFITPINRITSWIILAVNFGFVYLLYKQGAELIHTIQEGDLYVLELEDANEYFYM